MNARIGLSRHACDASCRVSAGLRVALSMAFLGLCLIALPTVALADPPDGRRVLAELWVVAQLSSRVASDTDPSASVQSPLTLSMVLSRVVSVHPQMQRARAEVEISRQQLDGARWGRFPSVSVGAAAGDGVVSSGSFRVQQPVYTFGRIEHAIDAAAASVDASTSGLGVARRALIERAALAHGRWLTGLQQLDIAQLNVSRQQELLDFIARRADGGLAARGDTRLAQGRLDQARARLAAIRAGVDQARTELESLMLQRLVSQPVAAALPESAHSSAESLAASFIDASPALERLGSQERVASAEAALKGADRLPAVVARVERAPNLITSHYDTRALLAVDYQSGAGLAAQSEYRARLVRIDAVRAEAEAQRRELELLARALWVQRATLREQRESIQGLVGSSADTVESFMRQFDAGRRSWLDVLNAERELFEARLAQAQIEAGLLDTALRIHAGSGALDALVVQP